MSLKTLKQHKYFRPGIGAALTILVGVMLWCTTLGDGLSTASYDSMYRFGVHPANKEVVLILMDDSAADRLKQKRGVPYNRALHAQMLDKLASDGCALAVMDIYFEDPSEPAADLALSNAMSRFNVIFAARQVKEESSGTVFTSGAGHDQYRVIEPFPAFATATQGKWGVAFLSPDEYDSIVRRQWPFPSPGSHISLPWLAAQLSGAKLDEKLTDKWIRYYGPEGQFERISYDIALGMPPGHFRGKTVFIGNQPQNPLADSPEEDKFKIPFARAAGGMEIQATIYLNLMNGDWLRSPGGLSLWAIFIFAGTVLGGGLYFCRGWVAFLLSLGVFAAVSVGAICLNYYLNIWFPWLIVVGAQIPCALVWALTANVIVPDEAKRSQLDKTQLMKPEDFKPKTIMLQFAEDLAPKIPNYRLLEPPVGKGGFGKVWLARNALNQFQAIKVIFRAKFDNPKPYDAEFNGLRRYKPVSEEHAGLLRVELVSEQVPEGYFYYVMELGDAQTPGWEEKPELYKPRDLDNLRKSLPGERLPESECLRITISLLETLDFLHTRKLVHRDIKPSNVIFVKGRPKLADVGLVSDARSAEQVQTYVGTPGYMPPPPEPPGTVLADIYAMGMLLYVITTGAPPDHFPGIATTLMEHTGRGEFLRLNDVILKACQPDIAQRYQTAAEMLADMKKASETTPQDGTAEYLQ